MANFFTQSFFNQPQKSQVAIRSGKIKKTADSLNWQENKVKMRDGIPPIYSDDIAASVGLTLNPIHFTGHDAVHVTMLDRKSKTIFYTDNQDLLSKWGNYAVAYELAHYLIHSGEQYNFDPSIVSKVALSTEIPDNEKAKEEQEASHFASYLLLPDPILIEYPGYYFDNLAQAKGQKKEEGLNLFAQSYLVPPEVASLRKHLLTFSS